MRLKRPYVQWIKRYILFHGKRHPSELSVEHVKAFLTHLAVNRYVAVSTQNQALNALSFLYKHILDRELGEIQGTLWAKKPQCLLVVLSQSEVVAVLGSISPTHWIHAAVDVCSGLRVTEVRLRIKDIDFQQQQIFVRSGKGNKDRVTVLPNDLVSPSGTALKRSNLHFEQDRAAGVAGVSLPFALERKTDVFFHNPLIGMVGRRGLEPRTS